LIPVRFEPDDASEFVAVCRLEFYLPGCGNLKQKRMFVSRLKDRLRHRFNVAVAEVGYQDLWQRARLVVVSVSNDRRVLDRVFEKVVTEAERHEAQLLGYEMEVV